MIITIYNFYTSWPKYKISFPKDATTINYSDPLNISDRFIELSRIFIFTRIENKSSLPVSVTEYTLEFTDAQILFSDSTTKATKRYSVEGTEYFIDIGDFQLLPPFKIEPYGAVEGYIFFPCPEITQINPYSAELTINTTRKKIKRSVLIHYKSKNLTKPAEIAPNTNQSNK